MKIITWNCNMAFRKKAGYILVHQPDILIVPECENPDKLKFSQGVQQPTDFLWFGKNPNKGLGIFSYSNCRFSLQENYNPAFRTIVPVAVTGGDIDFILYAIWAYNPSDPDGCYVEQVWKAIEHYDDSIANKQTMLIGDFNSNAIWDKKHRASNHSNVVKRLENKNIFSCYHLYHKQTQGKEQHATLYMYRHKDKPYHLDYCFVSADLIEKMSLVEIGDYDGWKDFSDHVPVMVTFS